ncbi:Conserved_hypothetical protein [Hexamita inflata]|uniref:MORN repeat protein n=1 Tax=Hexamita inflata TaxID=28002 RepID=A0AA86RPF7_9EUKA|nr:Conserved hypothetical protein [Hexamita inflata]
MNKTVLIGENEINFDNKGLITNQTNNQAQIIATPTFIYTGQINNGEMSGKGTLVFNDGGIYSGTFENSRFSGKGEFFLTSGAKMEGQFMNGDFWIGTLYMNKSKSHKISDGKWQEYFGNTQKILTTPPFLFCRVINYQIFFLFSCYIANNYQIITSQIMLKINQIFQLAYNANSKLSAVAIPTSVALSFVFLAAFSCGKVSQVHLVLSLTNRTEYK